MEDIEEFETAWAGERAGTLVEPTAKQAEKANLPSRSPEPAFSATSKSAFSWRESWKFILLVGCTIFMFVFWLVYSINEVSEQVYYSSFYGKPASETLPGVNIEVWISNVDTARSQLEATIYFFPTAPKINGSTGGLISGVLTDFHFYREIHAEGSVMKSAKITIPIVTGSPYYYPYDVYLAYIDLAAVDMGSRKSLPIGAKIVVSTAALWFDIAQKPANRSTPSFAAAMDAELDTMLSFELGISRTDNVIMFSMFIVTLLWMLTIAIVSLGYAITYHSRSRPGAPYLGLGPALLFTMPNLRASQPGIPPIGVLIDILGFFWNMILISIAAVSMIWVWIKRRNTNQTL